MNGKKYTHRRTIILSIMLAGLFTLGAAVYSYSGPNRTVATQVAHCVWEKSTCQYVLAKDDYRYHVTGSVSCASESKPWLSGDDYNGPCDDGHKGRSHWNKTTTYTDDTVTYPPAVVNAAGVCASPGLNGWCAGGGVLQISGSEPVLGEQIIAIEGTRNAGNFACIAASCNVPLVDGVNDFSYWAVSSFGDTSLMSNTGGLKQDSLAPQISGPTLSGALTGSGWYASGVTFTASATDVVSGLAGLTCTLDGNPSACTGVTVSADGAHTLLAAASDAAGNSSQKTASFQIDAQPPALNVQLSGTTGSNGWYHAAQVAASATDPAPGSGLAALEYALDGGAWTPFAASGIFTFPDGKHTLDVRAVDAAGNTTQAAQVSAWVDSVAPGITLAAPVGTGGAHGWYVSATQVGGSASDSTSGIDVFEYRLDNGAWTTYTGLITLADGVHTIVYYAQDKAGWVTQVVQTVKVDTQPPHISGSVSGTSGANGWYISNVTLSAGASDPGSGIAAFSYTLDGGARTPYTNPLILSDGQHTIVFQATDQAGLTDSFTQAINVDTVPPALQVLSVLPEWVQDTVTLNGTASDGGSGLLKVDVSTDNGASWHTAASGWNYAWNTVPGSDGLHGMHVRALDTAGLSTERVFSAQVDNGLPAIDLPAEWYIWDTVTLDASDAFSGLADVQMEISDPGSHWPARVLNFAPGHLPINLQWDRRFGDGTLAPSGDYAVQATARDRLGNTRHKSATIHIPWAAALLPAPATATPLSTPRAPATATAISEFPTETPSPSPTSGAAVLLFGTPGAGTELTPTPTTEPILRPTPTEASFSSWLASVFLPPATSESVTDAGVGTDPQPSPAPDDPNLLFDAAAIAAVAGATAYYAQKKREEAQAAAEAEKRIQEQAAASAASEAAARRRKTARQRKMSPLEAAAQKLKQAIAAVTQKEQKEWKAERYEQISETDAYKHSDNKSQFMQQGLENIKEQEAAYRENKKEEERLRLAAEEAAALAQQQALLAAWRAQQAADFDADMSATEKLAALRATSEYQAYTSRMEDWDEQQQQANIPGKGVNGLAAPAPSSSTDNNPPPPNPIRDFFKWIFPNFPAWKNGTQPAPTALPYQNMVQTQVAQNIQNALATATATPQALPILMPTFTPTRMPQDMWLTQPANFRSKPSIEAQIFSLLGVYSQVQLTGQTASTRDQYGKPLTYNEVIVGQQRGWVVSNVLEPNGHTNDLSIDPNKKVYIPSQYKPYEKEEDMLKNGFVMQDLKIKIADQPNLLTGLAELSNKNAPINFNLCGEFVAAYVTGRPIDTLITDWINQASGNLRDRARQVINDVHEITGYADVTNMLDLYHCQYKDFKAPFTPSSPLEPTIITPGRLKAQLDEGYSLIMSVNVNQFPGVLNEGTTPHWVVLDDIAPQGVNGGQVLIYNPMPNTQEPYTYDTLLRATGKNIGIDGIHVSPPDQINIDGIWVDRNSCK